MEPHILVATPLSKVGNLHIGTASFCADVNHYPNVDWGFTMTHSAECGRNVLIERHLKEDGGKTTHFLFIDADVVPPAKMLQHMLAHHAPVVTAVTPIFFNERLLWNVARPGTTAWYDITDTLPTTAFETPRCGGGALLVERRVLEAVEWPWFKTEYQPLDEHNKVIKTGEDVWFCLQAQKKGFPILADPTLICHHYNTVDLIEFYNTVAKQIEDKIQKGNDDNQ